ncbi:MAG: RrF2 family transcriptional regulator [Blautia sp.]
MLITRECDYAVRIVRALADGEKLCVNQVCEKEALTPAFVYKILKKMEKARIVKSYRGSNGGYALDKSIHEITLLDIYGAVEPELFVIECMNPKKSCVRNRDENGCRVHKELHRIQEVLIRELSSKTIGEIMER